MCSSTLWTQWHAGPLSLSTGSQKTHRGWNHQVIGFLGAEQLAMLTFYLYENIIYFIYDTFSHFTVNSLVSLLKCPKNIISTLDLLYPFCIWLSWESTWIQQAGQLHWKLFYWGLSGHNLCACVFTVCTFPEGGDSGLGSCTKFCSGSSIMFVWYLDSIYKL